MESLSFITLIKTFSPNTGSNKKAAWRGQPFLCYCYYLRFTNVVTLTPVLDNILYNVPLDGILKADIISVVVLFLLS